MLYKKAKYGRIIIFKRYGSPNTCRLSAQLLIRISTIVVELDKKAMLNKLYLYSNALSPKCDLQFWSAESNHARSPICKEIKSCQLNINCPTNISVEPKKLKHII